ncbi:G-type lectin S-receptor-like serine/threonine-protein kinase CES101 [Senna tora]|uniref:G-type lectin S-receptor-like serine/threonine-protein kinase CES101 n=1 Tax=Senna tora TaxID=362788 RepID=A0A834XFB3_9FABA|nr:G-type lectin S-receptor-like serine/threonine-protein kinase CES101 [Senna tora]
MAITAYNPLLFLTLTLTLHFTTPFSLNTLSQGTHFTRHNILKGVPYFNYQLHFFSISDDHTINFLGIRSTNERGHIWIANLNTPLHDHSPFLTIDEYGNLRIFYNDDTNVFTIFHSPYDRTRKIKASAVLEASGNLKLYEMDAEGRRMKKLLWQSFNYPNNILTSSMKLGFNHQTKQEWVLIARSFTLGMDPTNTSQLVIWWRGKNNVVWTSGMLNRDGKFPNLRSNVSYSFTYISNKDETFLLYDSSVNLVLNEDGGIHGVAKVSCFGGESPGFDDGGGCVSLNGPPCRNKNGIGGVSKKDVKSGNMSEEGYKIEETKVVSVYDCAMTCFYTCSCYAYSYYTLSRDNRGCQMWDKGTPFVESSDGSQIYFITDTNDVPNQIHQNHRKVRYVWIVVVAGAVVTVISSYLCFLISEKSRIRAKEKLKQKKLLSEVRARREKACHELQIYSFETIAEATNNFAPQNEIRQGGFGVVYKINVLDRFRD